MKTLFTVLAMTLWMNTATAGIWGLAAINNSEKPAAEESANKSEKDRPEAVSHSDRSQKVTGSAARNCYRCDVNPNVRFAEI